MSEARVHGVAMVWRRRRARARTPLVCVRPRIENKWTGAPRERYHSSFGHALDRCRSRHALDRCRSRPRRSGSAGALAAGPLTAAFDWLWYSSSAASSRLNDCVNMYAFIWSLTSVDSRDATIAVM